MQSVKPRKSKPKQRLRPINKGSGGTIKLEILHRWQKCSKCDEYLERYFYQHQCDNLPKKLYCDDCMRNRGKCPNCRDPFRKLIVL